MGAQGCEDRAKVLQMLRPRGAVDQDVVKKKYQDALTEEGLKHRVYQALECRRRIGEANDITRNSKWPWCVLNAVFSMSLD
jgi:hypothetical protein